jgi:predicted NACHT family NTPase
MFHRVLILLAFLVNLQLALVRPHRGGLIVKNGQRILATAPPNRLNPNAKAYNYRESQKNNNNNNQQPVDNLNNNEAMWRAEHRLNAEFEKLKEKQALREDAAEQHINSISSMRKARLSSSFLKALSKYSLLHKYLFGCDFVVSTST